MTTRIGPVTPRTLNELQIAPPLPPADADATTWEHRYQIWSVLDVVGQNEMTRQTGMLVIGRKPSENGIELTVRQDILLEEGNFRGGRSRLDATILCREDPLASPTSWDWTHRNVHQRTLREDLNLQESGQPDRTPMTCDFSLFEALGRMEGDPPDAPFWLYDGLHTLHPNHRLQRRADLDEDGLRCFTLLGPGRLPEEFWVDETGRVAGAMMGTRAYFLDPVAEEALDATEATWIYRDPAELEA